MNSQYDYYFRIEYTILESPCQPINTFQTVETMEALEQIVNKKNIFLFIFIFFILDKSKDR
jgi:hypothetical protein